MMDGWTDERRKGRTHGRCFDDSFTTRGNMITRESCSSAKMIEMFAHARLYRRKREIKMAAPFVYIQIEDEKRKLTQKRFRIGPESQRFCCI